MCSIHHMAFEALDSTNEEARRWIQENYKENYQDIPDTLITAQSQIRGRGRIGRHWYSPPGNLYMTLITYLPVPVTTLPQLSLIGGLAVYRALEKYIPKDHHLALKWPNDILVNGQKIGGILIETEGANKDSGAACIIGIGLNVLSSPHLQSYPTCCLLDFLKTFPSLDTLRDAISQEFRRYREEWLLKGLKELREEWLWVAYGLGKPVSAKVENGFLLYGRFVSLASDGAVLIESEDQQQHRVSSGEITYHL